ncbi:hypothetical protein EBR21_14105, partial [bacterium]|nr:hypothetical protein [bacterium]
MKPSKSHANLLLVGDDQDRLKLMSEALSQVIPGAIIHRCGSLRLGSPDAPVIGISALILVWENNPLQDWKTLLEQNCPTLRSSEGIICDISNQHGDQLLRRTAVLAKSLSREEVTFLGEFGVGCVQPLSNQKSEWTNECRKFAQKIERLIATEDDDGGNPAERSVRRFERVLAQWSLAS